MVDMAMIALLILIFALFYGFTSWCSQVDNGGEE